MPRKMVHLWDNLHLLYLLYLQSYYFRIFFKHAVLVKSIELKIQQHDFKKREKEMLRQILVPSTKVSANRYKELMITGKKVIDNSKKQ